MSNHQIVITGAWNDSGDDDLLPTLQIVMNHDPVVFGFAERNGSLHLYWAMPERPAIRILSDVTPFIAPMRDPKHVHLHVVAWLKTHAAKNVLDGMGDTDEEQGAFLAEQGQWGHGGGDYYCSLIITPKTRLIGK